MKSAPEPVLPTMNVDGSRRWLKVRLSPGLFWRARRALAWGLIALYALLPWVEINGHQALQLDLVHRRLHAFGLTFQATETLPFLFLVLTIFIGIFLATALAGRVWCGWACPQTVYMEFVFRPLERLFTPKGRVPEGRRILLKAGLGLTYGVVAFFLANTFLAYFVSSATLVTWVHRAPTEHPGPFMLVAFTTGLVLFDFAYFREQMCTVICPYARLQSVLLDRKSLIIGYDARRGEPRGKLGTVAGDCVDCNACVATCPTGIDIRNGLQLECIACAQCVDACDAIMTRIGRPKGLIRYASQDALATGIRTRWLRPRVVIYSTLLAAFLGALTITLAFRQGLDVWVLRGIGAPYQVAADGRVSNQLRVRIQNRTSEVQVVSLALADGQSDMALIAPENPVAIPGDGQRTASIFVTAPSGTFTGGKRPVVLALTTAEGHEPRRVSYTLLGPGAPVGGQP